MKRLLLTLLMVVSTIAIWAYDFEAATEDGVTLRYSITNTADLQVEVSSYNGSPSKVTIPETVNYANRTFSVTSIGESAFHGCSDLTSITIPNSVTSIGPWSFYECTALTSVTIPNGVTSIENLSFGGCSGLTSVAIPNSVTSIGYRAFSWCSGLTSVIIGKSVISIGYEAFYR